MAKSYLRIISVYKIFGGINLAVLAFTPALTHRMVTTFRLPLDPYASNINFYSTYIYEASCALFAGSMNLSANLYIFILFICLSFNFGLLSERLKRIGYIGPCEEDNPSRLKIDVYPEIVDHIKVHLKMNQ